LLQAGGGGVELEPPPWKWSVTYTTRSTPVRFGCEEGRSAWC
jgi:hypothetical protein